jgi:hypothetical protein
MTERRRCGWMLTYRRDNSVRYPLQEAAYVRNGPELAVGSGHD